MPKNSTVHKAYKVAHEQWNSQSISPSNIQNSNSDDGLAFYNTKMSQIAQLYGQ